MFDTFKFADPITEDSDIEPDELESDDEIENDFRPQSTDKALLVFLCENLSPNPVLIGSLTLDGKS